MIELSSYEKIGEERIERGSFMKNRKWFEDRLHPLLIDLRKEHWPPTKAYVEPPKKSDRLQRGG